LKRIEPTYRNGAMTALLITSGTANDVPAREWLHFASFELHVERISGGAPPQGFLRQYDALLLDFDAGGIDAVELIGNVRRQYRHLPIVVVTHVACVDQSIAWLDAGADDCLRKPVHCAELEARIKAVIRRRALLANAAETSYRTWMDREAQALFNNTADMQFTAREYAVLDALMACPGAIVSKDAIERLIYGPNDGKGSNVIEVLIHSLRKKLGASAIRKVRGRGWTLSPSAEITEM
jgi:two-component system, OmpR family, response regulator